MRIVFVTEMVFNILDMSVLVKNHHTIESWMSGLKATHLCFKNLNDNLASLNDAEAIITVVPKKGTKEFLELIHDKLKSYFNKTIVLQEGPCNYFQDSDLETYRLYSELLEKCKGIFAHDKESACYFTIYNDNVRTIRTSSNTKLTFNPPEKKGGLCGGTMCCWYNGQASFHALASSGVLDRVDLLKMGRARDVDDYLLDKYSDTVETGELPYLEWCRFLEKLSRYKVACHLMPTKAANSFVLNCAMAGVPCISSKNEVSEDLFPDLVCDTHDTRSAREKVIRLCEDQEFYNECVQKARGKLDKYHFENVAEQVKKDIKEMLK